MGSSKTWGVIGSILEVAAIVASAVTGIPWYVPFALSAAGAVAMSIGGAMYTPQTQKPHEDKSRTWNGPVTTVEAGRPVPVCYGDVLTGGQVIATFLDTVNKGKTQYGWNSISYTTPTGTSFRTSTKVVGLSVQVNSNGYQLSTGTYEVYYKSTSSSTWLRANSAPNFVGRDPFQVVFESSFYDNEIQGEGNSMVIHFDGLALDYYDFKIVRVSDNYILQPGVELSDIQGALNYSVVTSETQDRLDMMLAVSEGPIEGYTKIKANDIDVNKLGEDFKVETRLGTDNQSYITFFDSTPTYYQVNQQITGTTYTYTTTGRSPQGLIIDLEFPQGLYQINSNGDVVRHSVDVQIDFKYTSAPDQSSTDGTPATGWVPVGTTSTITFYGEKTGTFSKLLRIDNSSTQGTSHDVRFRRISPDESADIRKMSDVRLKGIYDLIYTQFTYPNTALVGVRALATELLSGQVPRFKIGVKGKKIQVPELTYNSQVIPFVECYYWNGNYYHQVNEVPNTNSDPVLVETGNLVEQWSNNPAWILYDLLTNTHYGLGNYIDATNEIDLNSFKEYGRFADELVSDLKGGYEKRCVCDLVVGSDASIWEWVKRIASSHRCLLIRTPEKFKVIPERPATPSQLFTMGNIIKDSFSGAYLPINEQYNTIRVRFVNRIRDFELDEIELEDENVYLNNEPVRKREIELYGVTRQSQALREARFQLNITKNIRRRISFKAASDSLVAEVGDVIKVQHDVPQWGYGGRILRVTTSGSNYIVQLDQTITINAGTTYSLLVRHTADDTLEEGTVVTSPTTTDTIEVSGFTTAPSVDDVYAFGAVGNVTAEYRIIGLSRQRDNTTEIQAIEYYSAVYDDTTNVSIDEAKRTYLPNPEKKPPSVTDLNLYESVAIDKDGTVRSMIHITYTPPSSDLWDRVNVYTSSGNNPYTWKYAFTSSSHDLVLFTDATANSTVYVAVESVSKFGVREGLDTASKASITLQGKTLPPSDVVGFNATASGNQILLSWQHISDFDRWVYEIKEGTDWSTGTLVATGISANEYLYTPTSTGTYTFWIKAIDTSNIYSQNATSTSITVTAPNSPTNISHTISGKDIILTWSITTNTFAIDYYEVRKGATYATSTLIGTVKGTSITINETSTGTYTYWVEAVDVAGNHGGASSYSLTISAHSAPTSLTHTIAGKDIILSWNSTSGTFALDYYEVRRGSTFSTATVIGTVKDTSITVHESSAGTYTYWVVPVDIDGIYGSESSYSFTISAHSAPSTVSHTISKKDIIISWSTTSGTFALDYYEVRRGTDYSTAQVVDTVQGTSITVHESSAGTYTYWIVAVDIDGIYGTPTSYTFTIYAPSAVSNISVEVVDNNILLKWQGNAGTFEIDYYEIREGSTYATSTLIGTNKGTFNVIFKSQSGTYTYWIVPVDIVGIQGQENSVSATVSEPPDFILHANWDDDFTGTKTNITYDIGTRYVAAVNTTETWQDHFVNNSKNTINDFINAGYTYFAEPALTTAQYIKTFDYGTTIPGTLVTATLTSNTVTGSPAITPTISVSTDNATWTDYTGQWQVFANNFRYVKVTLDMWDANGFLLDLENLNVTLKVKLKTDNGTGSVTDAQAGATVTFNKTFLDIDSINVTPQSTTPVIAIYDFVDVPNPTYFNVYLYDLNGNRITGNFSWTARGY